MSLVINFSIDKWTESMLSITSSQKCSLIQPNINDAQAGTCNWTENNVMLMIRLQYTLAVKTN